MKRSRACFIVLIMTFPATKKHRFHYVYILQSEIDPSRFYTGLTKGLETRLKAHNAGQTPHTAKFRPWKIKSVVALEDGQRARDFEHDLKSPSGQAFAKKHL